MTATASYPALRDQIRGILDEGQSHTRDASARERVEKYWHIGDALLSHVSDQPRADYGEQTVSNLSKDLDLSRPLLYDTLRFRRLVPIFSARRQLAWTHYRRLLHLPNQRQFSFYERAAHHQRWSVRQLEDAIQADLFTTATTQPLAVPLDQDPPDGTRLRARFGQLYIYRVVPSPDPRTDHLCLDLGFHTTSRIPLTGLADPRPGQSVASRKHLDGTYTFSQVGPTRQRYTYIAWV